MRLLERSLFHGCCLFLLLCFTTHNVLAKVQSGGRNNSTAFPVLEDSYAEVPAPSESIPGSPAVSAAARAADFKAMIKAAEDLGMPRLEAYLKEISGTDDNPSFPDVKRASGPMPQAPSRKSGRDRNAPTLAPDSLDDEDSIPSFYGKPLYRTEADRRMYAKQQEDAEQAKAEGNPAPLVFPIIYLDQLYNLDDKQAGEIFHLGTAEIPSKISKNGFAFCDRDLTLMQSLERPTNWPRFKWPEGDEVFNDISRIGWHGKFFVTDPETDKTQLFNLIVLDDQVGFIAGVEYKKGGYHPDHRDSFIVNYNSSEIFPIHIAQDEFRRVGPTIFLGSGIALLDLKKALPQYPHGVEKAVLDSLDPLIAGTNDLLVKSDNAIRGLRNNSNWTNIDFPPEGFLPFSFYFAVDCQDYRIPKLHYVPVVADTLTAFNNHAGFNPPMYKLPKIPDAYTEPGWNVTSPKFAATSFEGYKDATASHGENILDPNAPNAGIKFDANGEKVDPYVLFPYSLTPNVTGKGDTPLIPGFVKLPAQTLEPVFGKYWRQFKASAPGPAPQDAVEGAVAPSGLRFADDEKKPFPATATTLEKGNERMRTPAKSPPSAEEIMPSPAKSPVPGKEKRLSSAKLSSSGEERKAAQVQFPLSEEVIEPSAAKMPGLEEEKEPSLPKPSSSEEDGEDP
eukprot:jgi/Botrbrau1/6092/Bobra.177_1s0030.1